ncbi:hypothetical protein HK12_04125 [Acetobacter orientalis]|uniref:Uncharacterized protein n=1 Tax=Acetobacter orientalis TaxID=146474 RepID=A0A252A251_9PROT|nr:hypothetical protein HK12_04125 [Acetobacter orientalis]
MLNHSNKRCKRPHPLSRQHHTPTALCPVPCALCPVPCALCPVPCALYFWSNLLKVQDIKKGREALPLPLPFAWLHATPAWHHQ